MIAEIKKRRMRDGGACCNVEETDALLTHIDECHELIREIKSCDLYEWFDADYAADWYRRAEKVLNGGGDE